MLAAPWQPLANRPGRRSRAIRRANLFSATPSRWRRRQRPTHASSGRTKSCGASRPSSTTSTTRSIRRSTSTRRTVPRSCVTRATRRRSSRPFSRTPSISPSRGTRPSRRRSSPATSSRGSCTPVRWSDRPGSRDSSRNPSFASGVHREDVYKGAEELGVDLDEHIRTVVEALQPIAPELGLPAEG